ncbi:type VI secretion system tip protein VgrG [Pseudomonas corrugata]|uniref:type VI secretion system Vgr family protein n=1 Tax=Pseudomonas corrugata TaxID=47879 RepID=UPI001586056C|nr:type VI secretion system tip protein VgrG [Pseudomonas corrugata]MCI0994055.1 type VI secretion system tip protein VgrG [Pseudomonas corrugata]NUT64087.1 type VI secretion system tip protein VgrG [Pseudomonas corrugata]
MFAPANSPRFTLTLDSGPNELKVLEFTGQETISQPYRFDLELVSERPDLALEALLHRQAYLTFDQQGRGIHGQVYSVAQGDSGKRLTRYQISLVPRLAYLRHRINRRIFQHLSVPSIIAQVLKDHGIHGDAFQFSLGGQYPEREYCVQYGESDLAFIERICAEVGIHYHFRHSPDGHLLVFGDDQTVFPRLPESTLYLPGSGMAAGAPSIKRLAVRLQTRTSVVTLRDYDFRNPSLSLQTSLDSQQQPVLEDYRYPGLFSDREHGRHLTRRALERHGADCRLAEGCSDQCALVSGHFMQIDGHPRAQWNDLWLLTQITHRGRQPQVLEDTVADGEDEFQGYSNTFLATPWDVFFRPPLLHEKPAAHGYQPAVVSGPVDSEIHCDEFGRIKVQMIWDRDGKRDEHSSCWLRVATGWAHDRYGGVMIPRVGMEVLVGFMDGDVDKPLVVGCLPNGANPLPLDLPADKTRSILRSQSSPGGGGYNELRIEDRKGAEEIYLRAQRNWTQHVLHDQRVQVDHERSVVVCGTARHELKAEELRITHGRRQVEVRQDDHLVVTGERHIRVARQAVSASQHFHVSAGQQIVLDGGASATIQAGGHWISIGAGGIFSSVPIEVGGGPMAVTSAAPGSPGHPERLVAAVAAPLSLAQILSLQGQAPFCEECERCKDGVCAPLSALSGLADIQERP